MFINNFYKIKHNKKALIIYCRILVKMASLGFDLLEILLMNNVELTIAVLVVDSCPQGICMEMLRTN